MFCRGKLIIISVHISVHLGDRETTGAALLSLLAAPRIYPKSPLSISLLAARVGAYPQSRLSLLELELGLAAPPKPVSLCDAGFATLEVALESAFSLARRATRTAVR